MIEEKIRSRRDFLRQLSVYTAGGVLAGTMPWFSVFADDASSEKASPSERVRLAVLGTGSRGMYLMNYLIQIPNVDIVALCDDYQPNLTRALVLTGNKAKPFSNHKAMLEMKDIDGVVIATPLYLHAQHTIDCLQAGLHVFCEKSMAMTIDECVNMVRESKKNGKNLQIGHQRLFDPKYIQAIERIKKGDIGQVTQLKAYWHRNNDWRRLVPKPDLEKKINWRLYREYSLGLMTELASHQVQVANWALGATPLAVAGIGSINYWKDGRTVYDNVNLLYEYPGGITLMYDSMSSNRKFGLEEIIMGDKGTMELETGKVFAEQIPPAPAIRQLIHDIEKGVFSSLPIGGPSWVPEVAVDYEGEYITDEKIVGDGSDIQLEAFVNSIRRQAPIEGILREGFNATIPIILGIQAMENKQWVSWPEGLNFDSIV